jgi:hypothetical protein
VESRRFSVSGISTVDSSPPFDCLNVGEVLPFARGAFCGQQVFAGNEVCSQIGFLVDNVFYAAPPCGVELDARNRGENVNADRLASDAEERAGFREVGGSQALERRTEFC